MIYPERKKLSNTLIMQMEQLLTSLHGEPVILKIVYPQQRVSTNRIKTLVCEGFDVDWKDILEGGRKESVVYARMSFYYLAIEFTTQNPAEIACHVNRERTTVIAGHASISDLIWTKDEKVYPFIKPIIDQLNALKNEQQIQNETES